MKEQAIHIFLKNQTLSNLQAMQKLGLHLYEISDNGHDKQRVREFTLPIRGVTCYNDIFDPVGVLMF